MLLLASVATSGLFIIYTTYHNMGGGALSLERSVCLFVCALVVAGSSRMCGCLSRQSAMILLNRGACAVHAPYATPIPSRMMLLQLEGASPLRMAPDVNERGLASAGADLVGADHGAQVGAEERQAVRRELAFVCMSGAWNG